MPAAGLEPPVGGQLVHELTGDTEQFTCRHCCTVGSPRDGEGGGMKRNRRPRPPVQGPSAFAGFRFPPDMILLAVRSYLRYELSYRDLEELLAERGIGVDHVTLYRWVQRFTPELIDAARPRRHAMARSSTYSSPSTGISPQHEGSPPRRRRRIAPRRRSSLTVRRPWRT